MEPNFTIPEFFLRMKETEEFKDAVIAGGFVRDNYLGKKFTDVDVFYPIKSSLDSILKNRKLHELFTKEETPTEKDMSKYNFNNRLDRKFDAKVDGFDVDFVGYHLNEASFGYRLVESFSFGLDMAFTDGKELTLTKDFEHDSERGLIRLINLDSISSLPHIMERFQRIHTKYPNFMFTSDYVLERRKGAGWV